MNNETSKADNSHSLLLSVDLLDEILTAIADYEVIIDGEWGSNMSAEELMQGGFMPELYHKLLDIKRSHGVHVK